MKKMKPDKKYQKELFARLSKSLDFKKEKQLFSQLFKQPMLWMVEQKNLKSILPLYSNLVCPKAKSRHCLKSLQRTINLAKKTRQVRQFVCPGRNFGLCLPLVQGDALYGVLILCHLESCPTYKTMRLFAALNMEILEKTQKELELSKLYKTIRPRAVALSTIHTIRRLISSTLNLDELLPRIARLSIQVLRARQCLISLVDKKTGHLTAKAVVDLSWYKKAYSRYHCENRRKLSPKAIFLKKKAKPEIPAALKRIEIKVRHSGNSLLKKSYLSVPLIDEETIGVITVSNKMNSRPFDNFDLEILNALAEQAVGAIKNAQLYREQQDLLLGTVKALSTLLKTKSAYPYTHSKAFIDIVLRLAKELKLSEEDLRNLRFAATLHDAGEIGIPEEILKKPTALSGREFSIVKEHPKRSAMILSPLVERLRPAIAIIMHHHERFDGTGYPDQLKAEAIPLGARIMAVADSFEAMISRRPYRKTTSISEAVREIKKYSGRQFDPQVIRAFLKLAKTKSFKKVLRGIPRGRTKENL